jgi:hypothetical protein
MDRSLDDLLDALSRFRSGLSGGCYDLQSARRLLADLRLGLLRARQRSIALILSEGARGGEHLEVAVDVTLVALQALTRPRQRVA